MEGICSGSDNRSDFTVDRFYLSQVSGEEEAQTNEEKAGC